VLDRPLAEAVRPWRRYRKKNVGIRQARGSAAEARGGAPRMKNTPKLRMFDARGNRRDEIEFIRPLMS